jgi:hypothetical protein
LSVGKINLNLLHEVFTSVLTIALIIVAVLGYKSIRMVAWSYVIVMFLGVFFFAWFVRLEFSYLFCEMAEDYIPILLISMVMGLCVLLLAKSPFNMFIKLSLQIIIGTISYIILSIIFKPEGFMYILQYVRKLKK